MHVPSSEPQRGRPATLLSAALSALALTLTVATAQPATGQWELRACAPPQSLPFSDTDQAGYENRIIETLAEEMGARVTYEWVNFTEDLVNLHFAEGLCDVILGIPDGFEKGLNTLSYYTSPYVMVYRADSGLAIDSLDDPKLRSLRLGIHGAGTPPHVALSSRGLLANITRLYGGTAGSDDRLSVLVKAVAAGDIDVGFGWGPGTAYWADRASADLVVKPIEPQFEPPSTFQVQPMTMAVRREDSSLQALLNRALVARWDEVQAILAEYSVPVLEAPKPFAGDVIRPQVGTVVDVGIVLPVPTGGRTYFAAINDLTGIAALRGAQIAEGLIDSQEASTDVALVFHYATSPSPEAARRAAERLVLADGVDVLVGGVGKGQSDALAEVATQHGVLFLDVGSSDPAAARGEARWNVFHVAPSPEAYVTAMTRAVRERAGDQPLDWFVVHLDEPAGEELGRAAVNTLFDLGERVVDGMAVASGDPTFEGAFRRLAESGANAVMVLLPPTEQLVFMGGYRDRGGQAFLSPYPFDAAQTRNFLAASAEYGVAFDAPRVLAWETTLSDGRAGDFNRRFTSRFGQPADPTAWTTYEALMLVRRAAEKARTDAPRALADVFASGTPLRTAKGTLAFGPNHQLTGQTLYSVAINEDAKWGPTLSEQVAAAMLSRTMGPAAPPRQ